MVLKKKANISPPDPKGPPAWALAIRSELIAMFNQKIDEVKQYVDQKIDDLAKKNNLKTK